MIYEILDAQGNVTNTIVASPELMAERYPDGNYRIVVAPEPEPVPPEWEWYIDLGPFYDRFGAAKMAVLTSTDATVRAIISDLNIRKWVDLQRPDVAQALAYVGTKVPEVTAALQSDILTTPVTDHENLALRRTYFS